jgi:hypothetical protein
MAKNYWLVSGKLEDYRWLTKCTRQAMIRTMKDVIPAPAWMRKIMDASLKQRGITSAEARRQTQNALKGRTEKQSAKSGFSTHGRFKQAA